jgi:hypothetical protein
MVLFLFDPSRYSFYPTCAFHKATGLLCPGCGSLRAAHHLLHGELVTAFRFNPLLVTLLPLVTGFAAVYCVRKMEGKTVGFGVTSKWLWAVLGIAVVFTVWRNIPGGGLAMLPQ